MTVPRRPDQGRVGIVEGWELRRSRQRDANSGAWKGLIFVIGLIALIVVGGWFAARPVLGPAITGLFEENPGIIRMPVVGDLLAAELGDRLDKPAGSDPEEITVTIEQGQPVPEIEDMLVEAGLLTDRLAFNYLIAQDRADQLIGWGPYTLTATMTPRQVVERLVGDPDPPTAVVTVALRPGLRIEQIVAKLQQMKTDPNLEREGKQLELDPKEFRDLALDPPKTLTDEYDFLKKKPKDASLEGFLAGGVYEVPVDIDADEFLHLLLEQWDEDSGDLVAQARKAKVDFYDALTIASLVEKETPKQNERARVAGVYWNRLDPKVNGETAGLMQADPTVVYAADTMALADMGLKKWPEYVFWDTLGVDLNTVDVPKSLESFQTYRNAGLPDRPIATPTRESIEAAIRPDRKKGFLYFVSCPGEKSHTFAKTQAKHNKNVRKCGLPVN
jgi:UPF0755 protein